MTLLAEYRATYEALGVCIAARVPVILWGPPGQGKTSVIKDIALAQARTLEVILASIREPQDFAGLPVVSPDGMRLVPPDWARRLADDGNGILFLDEVNTAPPSVQAALLRVSLDKVAGDCYLGDGTSVVAAANPPEIAADGWDLAPPLANRFCHLDWELPVEVVRAGFAGAWPRFGIGVTGEEEGAHELADRERVLVGAFLNARPDLLTLVPANASDQGRAFPTPRSWEITATLLGWSRKSGSSPDVVLALAAGAVGPGAAREYLAYREGLDLPDPESVLADPEGISIPKRADRLYAVVGSTMAALRTNLTAARWTAMGAFLDRVVQAGGEDVAVMVGEEWIRSRPAGATAPARLATALMPIMREAGKL